jgi:hypothetical protein
MTTYKFTTPVVEEGPSGGHRLFYFFKLNRGLTVVKNNGVYTTGRWFTQDDLDSFEEYYIGGHEYTGISEATKAALIAGGIDVTEANFVAE